MAQDLKNDPNIKLGNVELPDGFEDRKNHKIRVTAWIDGDLYDELNRRAEAGEAKGKYQKLLNQVLRDGLFRTTKEKPKTSDSEVVNLIKEIVRNENAPVKKEMSEIRNLMKHNLPIVNSQAARQNRKLKGR